MEKERREYPRGFAATGTRVGPSLHSNWRGTGSTRAHVYEHGILRAPVEGQLVDQALRQESQGSQRGDMV